LKKSSKLRYRIRSLWLNVPGMITAPKVANRNESGRILVVVGSQYRLSRYLQVEPDAHKNAVEFVFKITALTIHPNLIFAPPSKLLFSKGLAMSVKDLQVFAKDSIQHM